MICSSHIHSQRNDFLSLNKSTLTVSTFTIREPARKPGAKIRRMTESNVIIVEQPLQSASTSARVSEKNQVASQRTLAFPDGIQDGTCFKNYDVFLSKGTTVGHQVPRRGIHKLQRHLQQVRATLPGKRHLILVRT